MHQSVQARPISAVLYTSAFSICPVFVPTQCIPIPKVSPSLCNKVVNEPQPPHLVTFGPIISSSQDKNIPCQFICWLLLSHRIQKLLHQLHIPQAMKLCYCFGDIVLVINADHLIFDANNKRMPMGIFSACWSSCPSFSTAGSRSRMKPGKVAAA
jgi:hypothetical protein